MSKLVTLEQAKKLTTFEQSLSLKKLGFDLGVYYFYNYDHDNIEISKEYLDHLQGWNRLYNHNEILDGKVFPHKCSAPTIHEALEWFREVKGFVFEIKVSKYTTPIEYMFRIYQYCPELRFYENESHGNGYLTHSEAELSLLDALIEYVSK